MIGGLIITLCARVPILPAGPADPLLRCPRTLRFGGWSCLGRGLTSVKNEPKYARVGKRHLNGEGS
jgi:hypothetical protein